MGSVSVGKGKEFEREVEKMLRALSDEFPKRVTIVPQHEIKLSDGRTKVVDFDFSYSLKASKHEMIVECQDREAWSSEIIDKILAVRNYSYRNRVWFVYRDEAFLGDDTKKLFDRHGILYFSISDLRRHLIQIAIELRAIDLLEGLRFRDNSANVDAADAKKATFADFINWRNAVAGSVSSEDVKDGYVPRRDPAMRSG